ncbi:MAG: hypothetical protein V2I33_24825 [Kangiellaceae bacterium]|nr:hypothetical protein [Kangiellaceae bacterium]
MSFQLFEHIKNAIDQGIELRITLAETLAAIEGSPYLFWTERGALRYKPVLRDAEVTRFL